MRARAKSNVFTTNVFAFPTVFALFSLASIVGCWAVSDGRDSSENSDISVISPDNETGGLPDGQRCEPDDRKSWPSSREVFANAVPGWKYWKTIGCDSDGNQDCDVEISGESEATTYSGCASIAPISTWEVAGSIHQMAPRTTGSVEYEIDSDRDEVFEHKGTRCLDLFGNRSFGIGRANIRFRLVGHPKREIIAFPIRRQVALILSGQESRNPNRRVLLKTTEYACVIMVRVHEHQEDTPVVDRE